MPSAMLLSLSLSLLQVASPAVDADGPDGMVWVPATTFHMGCADRVARPDEQPVHEVSVSGFWIDATEVTNRQFTAFVDATGYVTTAERAPDWEELKKQLPPGTPKPPDDVLVAGSVVFTPPPRGVALNDYHQWWSWIPGACWKQPEGPGSDLTDRWDHPVVHVSWDDAVAYCNWAGKQLPTEAQWECAARGGRDQQLYVWGNTYDESEPARTNIWQGRFPDHNTEADGHARTSPVKTYAPNALGIYDMSGNVWEWCRDYYRNDTYARRAAGDAIAHDPTGPQESFDPNEPWAVKRVQRGGSFLCHATYCLSYRPAARMPGSPDTGACHTGFRCVMTAEQWEQARARQTGAPEKK